MKETAVARRYAKAFAEFYKKPETLDTLSRELKEFAAIFTESRELRTVMLHPAVDTKEKQGILEGILDKINASAETKQALTLITEKDRLEIAPYIAEEFEAISFEALGKVRVEVTSAVELSDADLDQVVNKLSEMSGKKAVVDINVDPSLIGGIVARFGSVVYDGSVKNQLKALRVGLE